MENIEKDIQELEKRAESYKQAYIECMGAIKYLKSKSDQPKDDNKKDE